MGLSARVRHPRFVIFAGLLVTLVTIAAPVIYYLPRDPQPADAPWAAMAAKKPATDHTPLLSGPYETGSDVTRACLECHSQSASQVMATNHWTWESKPYQLEGHDQPVTIGKKTSLNNFCIGIQSNWPSCTSCHAGYGWSDANFDFSAEENVDCLVCHDLSGGYVKGRSGLPLEGVDLVTAAQSVGRPTRDNCGACHFNGGGGNAVKHGDLDQHLYYPTKNVDVHMGGLDFQCVDCHKAEDHIIRGRAISVSLDIENQALCTDCHAPDPHNDQRLNAHTASVACQTCHIPAVAVRDATKMVWDWSTAGQDLPEDTHTYLKIKGSFVYEDNVRPQYFWYSGVSDRYIMGDRIDPEGVTEINTIKGDIRDLQALIMPFKVHIGKQPFDEVYNYLLQPQTAGEEGYWTTFDWDYSLQRGAQATGLAYSGKYGFAETVMYWPVTHMVAPADKALQCRACHSSNGLLDWQALGYPGDPMVWGSRPAIRP
jgi:octaheme c-type cytochrome (tetrathionate reductase family)